MSAPEMSRSVEFDPFSDERDGFDALTRVHMSIVAGYATVPVVLGAG